MKTWKSRLALFFKGVAMGAADVVPGVSGGTIAFITGIYDELLGTIKTIAHPDTFKVLFKQGIPACWTHVNGTFLIILFAGIATSLFTLANVISYLLDNQPILIWSFFFGLIVASTVHIWRHLDGIGPKEIIGVLAGAVFVIWIATAQIAQPNEALWFVFVSGAIAICAMILPGISGSFILLMLGMYQFIIGAIKNLDLVVFVVFAAGAGIGLLSFSHVLTWLLEKWRKPTFSVLVGFLLGSLYVIWPWKQVLSTVVRHGEEVPFAQQPVLPTTFEQVTGQDPQIVIAVIAAVIGIVLVLGLEKFSESQAYQS